MKQLDIDVSPPAFIWVPYLTLTLVTFDIDSVTIDLVTFMSHVTLFCDPRSYTWPRYDSFLVCYRQIESKAYEPTMHLRR